MNYKSTVENGREGAKPATGHTRGRAKFCPESSAPAAARGFRRARDRRLCAGLRRHNTAAYPIMRLMRSSMRAAARPDQRDASYVGDSQGGLQHAARISSIIVHAAGRLLRPALVWPRALGVLLCACSVVPRAPAARRCSGVPCLLPCGWPSAVRLGRLWVVDPAVFLGAAAPVPCTAAALRLAL